MGNGGRWIGGVFIRCHHFNFVDCHTMGPGGGMLVVGQACPAGGCGYPNLIQPHPPECKLLPQFDSWPLDKRSLSAEALAAVLAAVDAKLPDFARALGFSSLGELEAHARADVPADGLTREAAMAACVAELDALHRQMAASIPARELNASTPPEVVPASAGVARGDMDFLALCLANYGKRSQRRLAFGSWALTALMARCVGTPVGALANVFSAFREEPGMGAAAEPKSAEAAAHAVSFARVIAEHAARGGVGIVQAMGASPRTHVQAALRREVEKVADVSAHMLELAERLAAQMAGGPPTGAMSTLVGGNKVDLCRSRSALFAAVFGEHSTRAHYQHIANLDVGGGVSYSLALLDCDRIFSLVVDLVLARVRGTPFDLREKVAAMGSPRAVDGGGGGWASISLDVLRSTQVSFLAGEAASSLWDGALALRCGAPRAIEDYADAARAVEATGKADRARHFAFAALEAQPADAASSLWDGVLGLRRGAPGALELYAAAARAVTAAGEGSAGARHFGTAVRRKRNFDAVRPMPAPKRSKKSLAKLKTFEGVRTAWIQAEELCMDWLDGARRKWHCRLCLEDGLNSKNNSNSKWNCTKAMRHITRKHLAALEEQEAKAAEAAAGGAGEADAEGVGEAAAEGTGEAEGEAAAEGAGEAAAEAEGDAEAEGEAEGAADGGGGEEEYN